MLTQRAQGGWRQGSPAKSVTYGCLGARLSSGTEILFAASSEAQAESWLQALSRATGGLQGKPRVGCGGH